MRRFGAFDTKLNSAHFDSSRQNNLAPLLELDDSPASYRRKSPNKFHASNKTHHCVLRTYSKGSLSLCIARSPLFIGLLILINPKSTPNIDVHVSREQSGFLMLKAKWRPFSWNLLLAENQHRKSTS